MTPAGSRVLDPCCGGGTTGEAALRAGCEFIGIDIDPNAVASTRARLAQAERELGRGVVMSLSRVRTTGAQSVRRGAMSVA